VPAAFFSTPGILSRRFRDLYPFFGPPLCSEVPFGGHCPSVISSSSVQKPPHCQQSFRFPPTVSVFSIARSPPGTSLRPFCFRVFLFSHCDCLGLNDFPCSSPLDVYFSYSVFLDLTLKRDFQPFAENPLFPPQDTRPPSLSPAYVFVLLLKPIRPAFLSLFTPSDLLPLSPYGGAFLTVSFFLFLLSLPPQPSPSLKKFCAILPLGRVVLFLLASSPGLPLPYFLRFRYQRFCPAVLRFVVL